MLKPRVIPILLIKDEGLVKGKCFKNHRYVGDPINAVKIFNEKEVDEMVILDIGATRAGVINFKLIEDIASEAFMPLSYGGGVDSVASARRIFNAGVEKVVLNTSAFEKPELISELSDIFGAQSIVVSIDVKKRFMKKYEIYVESGSKKTGVNLNDFVKKVEMLGAGEIIITSITDEGSMSGYDLDLVRYVTSMASVPVIASGGAGGIPDLVSAAKVSGISGVAAGSMFVFHGKHNAVLITYPDYNVLEETIRGLK